MVSTQTVSDQNRVALVQNDNSNGFNFVTICVFYYLVVSGIPPRLKHWFKSHIQAKYLPAKCILILVLSVFDNCRSSSITNKLDPIKNLEKKSQNVGIANTSTAQKVSNHSKLKKRRTRNIWNRRDPIWVSSTNPCLLRRRYPAPPLGSIWHSWETGCGRGCCAE